MSRKIPIDQAAEAELRTFAHETLGMEIHPNAKHETVLAKVKSAWDKDFIPVPDEAESDVARETSPVQMADRGPKPGYVRVMINITEGNGGSDRVPLGCNGSIMLVDRGVEQDIPLRFFESLKNSVEWRYESLPDGGINPVPRKVTSYPYQVIAFGAPAQRAA